MKRFKVKAFLAASAVLGSCFSSGVATNAFWGENAVRNVAWKLFGIKLKDDWKGREEEIRKFIGSIPGPFEDRFTFEIQTRDDRYAMWGMLYRLTEKAKQERDKALAECVDLYREEQDLFNQYYKKKEEAYEKLQKIGWDRKSPLFDELHKNYKFYGDEASKAWDAVETIKNSKKFLEKKERLFRLGKRHAVLENDLKKVVEDINNR